MDEKNADTLVELYDPDTHIYNAMGVMLLHPRRVAFIVPEHARYVYEQYREEYMALWRSRCCVPESVETILTSGSDIRKLADAISRYSGDGVVLDIEGGTPELYLAAGYLYGRVPGSFSCIRTDFADERITVYGAEDGEPVRRPFTKEEHDRISISAQECIRIYGGAVGKNTISDLRTCGMTDSRIRDDVRMMWRAMLRHSRRTWNSVVPDMFHPAGEGSLDLYVNGNDEKIKHVRTLVSDLVDAGALRFRSQSGSRRYYRCRSRAVMSCLRKAGELLELYVNCIANEVAGGGAICGVNLSFDGEEGSSDNEVDCIFTRGCTPVFISCKNGRVGSEELYKFAAVTQQFGGKAKVAILVAPSLAYGSDDIPDRRIRSIRERADLYNINVVTDIYTASWNEAVSEFRRVSGAAMRDIVR